MMKKKSAGFSQGIAYFMLFSVLICASVVTSDGSYAKAHSGSIYIRLDGHVEPLDAPISNINNTIYFFTDDIIFNNTDYDIVVERNNIIVDGNDYMLQGAGRGSGFNLTKVHNVTIKNVNVKNFSFALYLYQSSFNTISHNNITNNGDGVFLFSLCGKNTIFGNTIANNTSNGIWQYGAYNSTISENTIANNTKGIFFHCSTHNTIFGNYMVNNSFGISLEVWADLNIVCGNDLENNFYGIYCDYSSENSIFGNNIRNSNRGIYCMRSGGNRIFHNNFANSSQNHIIGYTLNLWDDDYPSGGNYWSDYSGVDEFRGPGQDESGSDGIGDTPYVIDVDNQDNYPLTKPYEGPHDIGITSVTASKTVIGQGYSVLMSMKVLNYGNCTEAVTQNTYANETLIISSTSPAFPSRYSSVSDNSFDTTGFACGAYVLEAVVSPVPGETDMTDNNATIVIVVTILGDISGDYFVNITDATKIGLCWMQTVPPAPSNTDIYEDGIVNIKDATLVGINWLKRA